MEDWLGPRLYVIAALPNQNITETNFGYCIQFTDVLHALNLLQIFARTILFATNIPTKLTNLHLNINLNVIESKSGVIISYSKVKFILFKRKLIDL